MIELLVPWLILAAMAVGGLFGLKLKWKSDAVKAEVQRCEVERAADKVKAITERAAVDDRIGAASPTSIGDELRRQDRPERN